MSIAVLTPSLSSQLPATSRSFGLDSPADVLQRIATIVRRYATDRVAVRGDAVEVELEGDGSPAPGLDEQARRLAVLARSWTGRAVRHEVRERAEVAPAPRTAEPATRGHQLPSVSVAVRQGEDAVVTAERVARALRRLDAISGEGEGAATGFILRLRRDDRETAMPLSRSVLESQSLERWLPPASLQGVTAIRLETRVRRDAAAPRRSPRNPVRSVPAPVLSRVS
jgi:hypothetical protein